MYLLIQPNPLVPIAINGRMIEVLGLSPIIYVPETRQTPTFYHCTSRLSPVIETNAEPSVQR